MTYATPFFPITRVELRRFARLVLLWQLLAPSGIAWAHVPLGGSLTNLGVQSYNKTRTASTYWVCSDIQGAMPGYLGSCGSGWSPVQNVTETLNSTAYVGGRIVGSVNAVSAQSIQNLAVAPGTATASGSLQSVVAPTGSAQGSGAAGTALTAGPGAGSQSLGAAAPLAGASGGGSASALASAAATSTTVSGSAAGAPGSAAAVAVAATSGVAVGTAGTAVGTPVSAQNGIAWTRAGAGATGVTGQASAAALAVPVTVGIAQPGGMTPGGATATIAIGDIAAQYTLAAPERLHNAGGKPAAIVSGGTLLPNGLPGGGLFSTTPAPNGAYLVRAAGALSNNSGAADTDLLFDRTGKTERRLGDAVYEQQLVRDQILRLTGRTNLGNYADSQAQFAALVGNGVAYAEQFNLSPGIALSAEQMKSLTQDIVWLEKRTVDTPNGQETVLAPVVYLAALKAHDLDSRGGIGGNLVVLDAQEGIVNQGVLEGERVVAKAGKDIAHSGDVVASQGVALTGGRDLASSGIVDAGGGDAVLSAGRDLTLASALESVTATVANPFAPSSVLGTFEGRQVERIASVQGRNVQLGAGKALAISGASVAAANDLALSGQSVSIGTVAQTALSVGGTHNGNAGGTARSEVVHLGSTLLAGNDLTIRAAQDLNLTGSLVSAAGSATLTAGGNLAVQAAKDVASLQVVGRATGHSADWLSQDQTLLGSQIVAGKDLTLGAGIGADGKVIAGANADLTILASSLKTATPTTGNGGDIKLISARDINIGAQNETRFVDSRFNDSGSNVSQAALQSSTAVGSLVNSAGELTVVAKADLTLLGSALAAGGKLTAEVGGDLKLFAAQSSRVESIHSHLQNSAGTQSLAYELEQNRQLLSSITAGSGLALQVGGGVIADIGTPDAQGKLQADRMTAEGVVQGDSRQQVSVSGSGKDSSKVLGSLSAQGIRNGAADAFTPGVTLTGQAAMTALLQNGLIGVRNDPAIQKVLATPAPNGSALTYQDDAGKVQLTVAGQAKVQEVYSRLRLNETFVEKRGNAAVMQVVTLAAAIALTVTSGGAGAAMIGVAEGTASALVANAAFTSMASTMIGQLAGGADFGDAFQAAFKAGVSSAITAGILNTPTIDGANGMQSINQWSGIQDIAGTGGKIASGDWSNLGQTAAGIGMRATVTAGVNTAIYGTGFADSFKASVVGDVAAIGANVVGQSGLSPVAKTLSHAGIGCAAAAANGKDCASGAIGGAAATLINPAIDLSIGGNDGSGWGANPAARAAGLQLASMAGSAVVANALGKDGMTAALAAQNETLNNFLSPKQIASKKKELLQAKDQHEQVLVEQKYAAIDSAQQKAAIQCLVNGNCASVTDTTVLKQTLAELQASCAPPRACSVDTVQSIAELHRIYGTAEAVAPVYLLEEFFVGGKGVEKLIGLAGTGASALTIGARDAAVEFTRGGERFVRVGARPDNLKFTFEAPGGAQAGTYAFPEKTFLEIGQNPVALKKLGDLPGAPPQYFRILEPPAGTPIQRGIVPGGEFGGIGGVPEVLFPKGF